MKLIVISFLTLIFMSLSDILSCNERKRIFEKAAMYRNKTMIDMLGLCRVLQIPLFICLGILSWKVLIAVIIIAILSLRIFLDGFVERFMIVPLYLFLESLSKRSKEMKKPGT